MGRTKQNMSINFLFIFALSFVLAWSENLPEDQVLESENNQSSENTQNSENSDVSTERSASLSEKDEIKLSDLLFEYLDVGKNNEKDSSETKEPAVAVDPRKMHKE